MVHEFSELIEVALQITERASEIPRRYFGDKLDVDSKQDESPVTIADRETEQFIRKALKSWYPKHAIFGEEFGRQTTDSAYEWVIDPIDGTRSFISGMPLYGMLLALLKNNDPILGIVRMPELEQVFIGYSGHASTNNGEILHCSNVTRLDDAVVYINEGEKLAGAQPALFKRLCSQGRLHRLGYDCYPHLLVASGKVDVVIDFDLKPYDFFPLIPIVKAAGGVVSGWAG